MTLNPSKQVSELRSEIACTEKKCEGRHLEKTSLAHPVEQTTFYVDRESERLDSLRKGIEMAQSALAARDAELIAQ